MVNSYLQSGQKLSRSTSLSRLLRLERFQLTYNGKSQLIEVPESVSTKSYQPSLPSDNGVNEMRWDVARLYTALNIKVFGVHYVIFCHKKSSSIYDVIELDPVIQRVFWLARRPNRLWWRHKVFITSSWFKIFRIINFPKRPNWSKSVRNFWSSWSPTIVWIQAYSANRKIGPFLSNTEFWPTWSACGVSYSDSLGGNTPGILWNRSLILSLSGEPYFPTALKVYNLLLATVLFSMLTIWKRKLSQSTIKLNRDTRNLGHNLWLISSAWTVKMLSPNKFSISMKIERKHLWMILNHFSKFSGGEIFLNFWTFCFETLEKST